MKWKKLGLIYNPDKRNLWMYSHAQLPVADHLKDNIYRIYFASRNKLQHSSIAYVDIDITNPKKILRMADRPVLEPGLIGCFDEHGVFPSSIMTYKGRKFLYYIGWTRGYKQSLFYASIGLAVSEDNGESYFKYSAAPILSRSKFDPCLVTSPHVFIDNNLFRMTYVSGIKWVKEGKKLKSYYHIKYAESHDGIIWDRNGIIAIDFSSLKETNIARSSVIKESGVYKMWYCYVNGITPYRIGYAESIDCINWIRKDSLAGITVSKKGFDNNMICYPNVVVHNRKKIMFYNGNNYGHEGFGMAVEVL